ncbi:MAG: nucleoside recognition domain-containing protein, partial [Bacillota bacterium]
KAGGHGKQALCMCMGFGCNAAGVTACRIIESRRERLLAILTNVFVPCNGRFPTLIALSALFFGSGAAEGHLTAAVGIVVSLVIFGILISLLTTWLLSRSLLAGNSSTFALEMPPYRLPRTGQLLWYSLRDRTLRVLGRAVCVAAPAGALIWLTAHLHWQDRSLLALLAALLDPVARQLGLDGYIAVAFILGLPANEIVLPIMLMGYLATGTLIEPGSLSDLRHLLQAQGWTWLTALCTMLFSLLHYPCATTLLTIRRETGSRHWTLLAALLPLAIAGTVCFIVYHTVRYLANC